MGFGVLLFGVTGALRRLYDDRPGVEGVGGIDAGGEGDQSNAFMLKAHTRSWSANVASPVARKLSQMKADLFTTSP